MKLGYRKSCTDLMWERACSRKGRVSHPIHQLTHRIREQARFHTSPLRQGEGRLLSSGKRAA
ncbi:hypothetical protein DXU77_11075 [Pseudomonas lactis]|nr:hypothetical protein [Pseudomonas lactis]